MKNKLVHLVSSISLIGLAQASILNVNSPVTLGWNPNSESDLAGYRIHYGLKSGEYILTIDVKNVTQYALELESNNTYFAAVSAYNWANLQSYFSDEITFKNNNSPAAPKAPNGFKDVGIFDFNTFDENNFWFLGDEKENLVLNSKNNLKVKSLT